MKIPVYLEYAPGYGDNLRVILYDLLELFPVKGKSVLIKPNFIGKKNYKISCTNPYLISIVCDYFMEKGFHVLVGDSPAFGSVKSISHIIGLTDLLKDKGIELIEFQKYRPLRFPYPLARQILEVDCIVNIPKLKAHGQMAFSLGTKNLFGLIVGYNKLLAHIRFGQDHRMFSQFILKIVDLVPNTITILDGIWAMEGTGPLDGQKKICNLIGISNSPIALDTALYHLLGIEKEHVPLWMEASKQGIFGSEYQHIELIKGRLDPQIYGFTYPSKLKDISFRPDRVFMSFIKRNFLRIFQ